MLYYYQDKGLRPTAKGGISYEKNCKWLGSQTYGRVY